MHRPDQINDTVPRTLPVRLLYFAWIRERVGLAEETLALPVAVETVSDLMSWLAARGPGFAAAFAQPQIIRAALDRRHVRSDASISGAREIAFFPPVTGG